MKNILLEIAYDGSRFHGWQRQPGIRTAQGVLEEKLTELLRAPIALEGTSRTDAGVHALGQCATLRGDFGIPTDRIPVAANNLLSDISIRKAEEKPENFHARFDAAAKTYVYRFAVAPPAPVFLRNYACLLAYRPNLDSIVRAAKYIEGTHDFACFQAAGGVPRKTTVRTVFSVNISEETGNDPAGNRCEWIEIAITGDGFLYNMVRIIAGTLADAGYGKIMPDDIGRILASKDRKQAGPTAPPQGLYLKKVYFDKTAPEANVKE